MDWDLGSQQWQDVTGEQMESFSLLLLTLASRAAALGSLETGSQYGSLPAAHTAQNA